MNSESSKLNSFAHRVGQNWYHLVMISKYRSPVFKQEHQRKLMLEAVDLICIRHNIDLFAKEVMDDHVHLFVSCPPSMAVNRMISIIKGGTSYFIRSKNPSLRRYRSLWSSGGMFRSVGSVNAEIVKHYIDESNSAMRFQKKLM